jgi:hypothetical protein
MMFLRKAALRLVAVLALSLIAIRIIPALQTNIQMAALNQATGVGYLSPNQRQARLSLLKPVSSMESAAEVSPQQALFIANHYQHEGRLPQAISWYRRAVESTAFRSWQEARPYQWRPMLTPAGDISLTEFDQIDGWVSTGPFENPMRDLATVNHGVASIHLPPGAEGLFAAYSTYPNRIALPVGPHRNLAIRLNASPGIRLSVEAAIDGDRQPLLQDFTGTSEWQTVALPLPDGSFREVRIILFGTGSSDSESIRFDWIRLQIPARE